MMLCTGKTWVVAALFVLAACKSDGSASDGTGDTAGSGGTGGTADDGGGDGGTGEDGGGSGDGGGGTGSDGGSDGGGSGGDGIECKGDDYQCTDGEDNDGDGLIDAADPECTGPCDNDEGSFETGIPGDNMDCWQDCFFDGDSGHGNDGCRWDLKCDPANPGAGTSCEYDGGNNCESKPADTPEECIEFCAGLVPNGCDCFGCCTIQTDNGEVHVYLGSGEDCSLDNLEACNECTPNDDCGNPCEPEDCELCFGMEELPEECDEPDCPEGLIPCGPAAEVPECPPNYYCVTGCCIPYIPPP